MLGAELAGLAGLVVLNSLPLPPLLPPLLGLSLNLAWSLVLALNLTPALRLSPPLLKLPPSPTPEAKPQWYQKRPSPPPPPSPKPTRRS